MEEQNKQLEEYADEAYDRMKDEKAEAQYEEMDKQDKQNKLAKLQQFTAPVDCEYIKVMKNSKGYNWDFKMLTLDVQKLKQLNNELLVEFGGAE